MGTRVPEEGGREIHQSARPLPYTPPAQFKAIEALPLMQEGVSDDKELWLVRIPDSQLGAEDLRGKPITISLSSRHETLGSFKSATGNAFEIANLRHTFGPQLFAFLPRANSPCLDVHRISRQVALVRSLDSPATAKRSADKETLDVNEDVLRIRASNDGSPSSYQDATARTEILNRGKGWESQGHPTATDNTRGVFSTLESIQDDEDRISMDQLLKSKKKSTEIESHEPSQDSEDRISMGQVTKSKMKDKEDVGLMGEVGVSPLKHKSKRRGTIQDGDSWIVMEHHMASKTISKGNAEVDVSSQKGKEKEKEKGPGSHKPKKKKREIMS